MGENSSEKRVLYVVTRLGLDSGDEELLQEMLCEMDYDFKSQTEGINILDTEIVDHWDTIPGL